LIPLNRSNLPALSSAASVAGLWTPAPLNAASKRPKVADGRRHHGGDIRLVGDVAAHGKRMVTRSDELVADLLDRSFVDVREHNGGPDSAKAVGVARPMPFPAPVTIAMLFRKSYCGFIGVPLGLG
jgi:hypothetical protein